MSISQEISSYSNFFSEAKLAKSFLDDALAKLNMAKCILDINPLSENAILAYNEAESAHKFALKASIEAESSAFAAYKVIYDANYIRALEDKLHKNAAMKAMKAKIEENAAAKAAAGLSTKAARDKLARDAMTEYNIVEERAASVKNATLRTANVAKKAAYDAAKVSKESSYASANFIKSIDADFNYEAACISADIVYKAALDTADEEFNFMKSYSTAVWDFTIRVPYNTMCDASNAAFDGPNYTNYFNEYIYNN